MQNTCSKWLLEEEIITKKWKDILKDIVAWYRENADVIFFRNYLLDNDITLEEFNRNCTEGNIPNKYRKMYKMVYEYEETRLIEAMVYQDKQMSTNGAKDYLQNYHNWKPKGRDNSAKEEDISEIATEIGKNMREKFSRKIEDTNKDKEGDNENSNEA